MEIKQSFPSSIVTTNSNTSPTNANKDNTNENLNNYWNTNLTTTPTAGSYTNVNANDSTKPIYLLKNNEISNIKAAILANKKEKEKGIQFFHRKSIFIY